NIWCWYAYQHHFLMQKKKALCQWVLVRKIKINKRYVRLFRRDTACFRRVFAAVIIAGNKAFISHFYLF
ncbi:MAG: hypothetical protein RSC97_11350, partial [Eubacterium sp.]